MSTESKEGHPELDAHPRRDELSSLVRTVALAAADEQRTRLADGLDELMGEAELSIDDGAVGSFNVLKAMQRAEPPVLAGRKLLALLLARGIVLEPPAGAEQAQQVAKALTWLAAHTYLDALSMLDAVLEPALADRLWAALGETVRDADQLGTPAGRAQVLTALAALAHSSSPAARAACDGLASELNDPMLRSLVVRPPASSGRDEAEPAPTTSATAVSGQLIAAPFGPVMLVIWTVTGLMVIRYLLRFMGSVLLRLQRSAEVKVDATGITVATTLAVVGRTIGEKRTHIPRANLAVAAIEVRYPRVALYAGLVALAVGTFLGASLIVDGGRAGSPSLLALGAAVFGIGVVCDLVFASLWPSRQGRTRLIFTPRKGRPIALSTTERGAATAALRQLGGSAE